MNTFADTFPHPALRTRRSAPEFHWFFVLVLGVCTFGFFLWFWEMYLSIWSRRLRRINASTGWYAAALAVLFLEFFVSSLMPLLALNTLSAFSTLWLTSAFLAMGCTMAGRLELNAVIESYYTTDVPWRLRMSPVKACLLGGLYFQYHLRRISLAQRGRI
jgi:hypothetical protein